MKYFIIIPFFFILGCNSNAPDTNRIELSKLFLTKYAAPEEIDYLNYKKCLVVFRKRDIKDATNMIIIVNEKNIYLDKTCLDYRFLDWIIGMSARFENKGEVISMIYNATLPLYVITCDPITLGTKGKYFFDDMDYCNNN